MTFQRLIRAGSLLFVLLSMSTAADAQMRRGNEGGWQLLGRSYVNSRGGEHDTIVVNSRGSFQSLQLEVKGGSIEFQRVVVHFENGQDHVLEIRDRIPANGRTREIDLPGDRRRIRSVEFWYSRESWRSRPYVNLWGRSGSDTQGGGSEGRWENLGRAYVNSRVDHDRIPVTNRGAFRALQLGVKGGTIEFQRVVVHFENGEDHQLEISDRIPDGGKTRVIDLPGDRRRIRSVEFWYSKEGWRSRPLVNVWGRR